MASPGTVNISAADQKDLEKVRIIRLLSSDPVGCFYSYEA